MSVTQADVDSNLIFLSPVGSTIYGTALPDSDIDMGGICILPDKRAYIGDQRFEQFQGYKNPDGTPQDKTVFALQKIVGLCADNNPNCLDYLGVPGHHVRLIRPEWKIFVDNVHRFLSARARHTFVSYARSQMKRVETHREYLRNPKLVRPTRADFGLPEVSVFPQTQMETLAKISTDFVAPERQGEFYNAGEKILTSEFYMLFAEYMPHQMVSLAINDFRRDQMAFLRMLCSISGVYIRDEYVDAARAELAYSMAVQDWKRYAQWKTGRNAKRAALEALCGFDAKHVSHAVRLSRMGREILEGRGLRVDRTGIDAQELIDIRVGNRSFEDCQALVEAEFGAIETVEPQVPKHADRQWISETLVDVIDRYVWGTR